MVDWFSRLNKRSKVLILTQKCSFYVKKNCFKKVVTKKITVYQVKGKGEIESFWVLINLMCNRKNAIANSVCCSKPNKIIRLLIVWIE